MTLLTRGPVTGHTLLRLAGLVVVLIGLFGMHGLASHGTEGATGTDMTMSVSAPSPATTPTSVSGPAGQPFVEGATPAVSSLAGIGRAVLTSIDGGGHGDMGMSMAGLCVAILLIGVTGLLLFLNRSLRVTTLWSAPRVVARIRPVGREPDPPSLSALSVQRC